MELTPKVKQEIINYCNYNDIENRNVSDITSEVLDFLLDEGIVILSIDKDDISYKNINKLILEFVEKNLEII